MELMRKTLLASAVALLLTVLAGTAYATRHERLIEGWRPVKFEIELRFDDRLSSLSAATTTVTVLAVKDNLRTVDLDFGEMNLDSVTIAGKPVAYQNDNRLLVSLPVALKAGEQVAIMVKYHGRPSDGLIFSSDRDGQPSVVGDNWPDRVHNWIPCLDHPSAKASVSYTITAPADDLVVANGALVRNVSNADRTITWTYAEPAAVSPYNMIVAVAPFAHGEVPATIPLSWYVPRSDGQFAPKGFASAADAVRIFSETVAPFPYPKLALIIGATKFGGMENSGAIVFPGTLFGNFAQAPRESDHYDAPREVIDVVAHETAHQWFGDSVTESTWADLWLSEGFATYFAGLFRERTDGAASFRSYMEQKAASYFVYEKAHRTPIHDTETADLMALLNPNNYEKGSWVLHMLRGLLGDQAFFAGLRAYYQDHLGETATSDDLRLAMEKSSGKDLKEFFARWVFGAGHPVYDVGWRWSAGPAGAKGTVNLTVTQTQADAPFLTPLTVEFKIGTTSKREVVVPTGKTSIVKFPFEARPDTVTIDPDGYLLKEATVKEVRAAAAGRP
jgi:aminopeptidase N